MILKKDFIYPTKQKNRPLHIYLPDNYFKTNERYPVMYFFDGHNLFLDEDATYGKSWGVKKFLETWPKDMIIVGIECGHEGQERLSEYLPYPARFGRFKEFEPTGDETFRWIIEDIKPMIDQTYRTIPFRECTGIGGSSFGGLMAVYGIIHHNRYFSKAACVSSSIAICMDSIMNDFDIIDPDTRVYLSWGTKEAWGVHDVWQEDRNSETYKCNLKVANEFEKYDATVKMYCQVGGGHCEADWEKQIPDFMDFLWMR